MADISFSSHRQIYYLKKKQIVALDYIWIMFSFLKGGTGVFCNPLFVSVAPSCVIPGRVQMLAGELFDDPFAGFGCLPWDV